MIIYIDVLLAVNLIQSYILLVLTVTSLKESVKTSRLIIGSVMGSIYSLLVLAPELNQIIIVLLKFMICVSIVCVTFNLHRLKLIAFYSVVFFLINACFGGLMYLIQGFISANLVYLKNGMFYININITTLLVCSCICYALIRLILHFLDGRAIEYKRTAYIILGDKRVELKAICDSGNSLIDPISSKPVHVVVYSAVFKLLPHDVRYFLENNYNNPEMMKDDWKRRLSLISADFAVGSSVLPMIRADKMIVMNGKQKNIIEKPMIAIVMKPFDSDNYQLLLHSSLKDNYMQVKEAHNDCQTAH